MQSKNKFSPKKCYLKEDYKENSNVRLTIYFSKFSIGQNSKTEGLKFHIFILDNEH